MIWIKNTIIEVKNKFHYDLSKNVEFALMCHFEEADQIRVYPDVIAIFYTDANGQPVELLIYNRLPPSWINYPFKCIIEEHPDDYHGTCSIKLLQRHGVFMEEFVASGSGSQ